jgi:hypothetical protein
MMPETDALLSSDEFWESAFDPRATFYEELRTEFRAGILDGNEDNLAWGHLGIRSITDRALWPILNRLLQWAGAMPGGEFVESLVFFVSDEHVLPRLQRLVADQAQPARTKAETYTRTLAAELVKMGANNLAEQLSPFIELLADGASPGVSRADL